MPGKCSFQEKWLKEDKYKDWLIKDSSNKHLARCAACKISLNLSSMGESVLKQHMVTERHQRQIKVFLKDARFCVTDYFRHREHPQPAQNQTAPTSSASVSSKLTIIYL